MAAVCWRDWQWHVPCFAVKHGDGDCHFVVFVRRGAHVVFRSLVQLKQEAVLLVGWLVGS